MDRNIIGALSAFRHHLSGYRGFGAVLGVIGMAFVFYMLLTESLLPARLVPVEGWEPTAPGWLAVAHDFDHDGTSEIVEMFYDISNRTSRLILRELGGTIKKQVNFVDLQATFMQPYTGYVFEDVSGDGIDDVLFLGTRGNRLAVAIANLYSQDPAETLRGFGVLRCERCGDAPWELYLNDMRVVDLNQDRRPELLFSMVTGGVARFPRGVYLVDLSSKQVVRRFEAGLYPMDLDLWDITQDGTSEVIVSTYASANLSPEDSLSDAYTWALVLDTELKPVFPPQSFYGFTSHFRARGYTELGSKRSYLVGGVTTTGKVEEPTMLLKINARGEVIQRKVLDYARSYFYMVRSPEDSLLLVRQIYEPVNVLERYGVNFNLRYRRRVEPDFSLYRVTRFSVDVNADRMPEVIGFTPSSLYLYDHRLYLLARYDAGLSLFMQSKTKISPVLFDRLRERGLMVSIPGRGSYLLRYEVNPWFAYRGALALLLALGIGLMMGMGYLHVQRVRGRRLHERYVESITPEALFVLDPHGRLLRANQKARMLFGWHGRVEQESYTRLLSRTPQMRTLIARAMQQHAPVSGTVYVQETPYIVEVIPVEEGRHVEGYLVRMQEYDRMVSGDVRLWIHAVRKLTHDIKGSLSNMAMGLRRLEQRLTEAPEDVRDILHRLQEEVETMAGVTRSFLKQMSLEEPQFQEADISEVVHRSLQRFEPYWDEDLNVHLQMESVPPFPMDAQQVQVALENLIANAIEAMGGEGELKIAVRVVEDMFTPGGKACEIIVTDTGHGIPEERISRIFEPGYTTRESGTGIGLALVRKIVEEEHGGHVSVKSIPGVSTSFELYFPIPPTNTSTS